MAAEPEAPSFHLVHPDHYAERGYPHDVWTQLRREDPVHRFEATEGIPFWAITKHADATMIGRRPDLFLNGPRLTISHQPEVHSDFPPTLIQLDPPKHGAYRRLVAKRFKPGALKRMHADIARIGTGIVAGLAHRARRGPDVRPCVAASRPPLGKGGRSQRQILQVPAVAQRGRVARLVVPDRRTQAQRVHGVVVHAQTHGGVGKAVGGGGGIETKAELADPGG